jgi:hypothetical protein
VVFGLGFYLSLINKGLTEIDVHTEITLDPRYGGVVLFDENILYLT